jgi:hypothetical protein
MTDPALATVLRATGAVFVSEFCITNRGLKLWINSLCPLQGVSQRQSKQGR